MQRATPDDDSLLDLLQRRTLRYFWDFAHPTCGMARERSAGAFGYDLEQTVCTGGTGFGLLAHKAWARYLAIVVAVLGLINFPIGTLIGLYTLWVLFQERAADYFQPQPAPEDMVSG